LYITVNHVKAADAKRDKSRANKEAGDRMASTGLIGGPFQPSTSPAFVETRTAVFERLWAEREAAKATLPEQAISITLPNGDVKSGMAFKTTPLEIALGALEMQNSKSNKYT
jgi:threonyl-tRNA synthetase